MKTEKELWTIIEQANWKSDHSYYRIEAEWSKLDKNTYKQLVEFISEKANELKQKYEDAWLGNDGSEGIDVSDDGWMDLTAEVVGRGEEFFNSITADKLRRMADEHDYKECFLYCLSY
jgi:hypothetical protein